MSTQADSARDDLELAVEIRLEEAQAAAAAGVSRPIYNEEGWKYRLRQRITPREVQAALERRSRDRQRAEIQKLGLEEQRERAEAAKAKEAAERQQLLAEARAHAADYSANGAEIDDEVMARVTASGVRPDGIRWGSEVAKMRKVVLAERAARRGGAA